MLACAHIDGGGNCSSLTFLLSRRQTRLRKQTEEKEEDLLYLVVCTVLHTGSSNML